jgi:GntP family gluconate:H+ symporter
VWNNRPVISQAAHLYNWYLPACVAGTVLLLLLLIARLRLHPALALMIAALSLGIASGMPLAQVPVSFTAGVGNLMGHIAIILGLGAILGRLLDSSGAAAALGGSLVELFGARGVAWAMLILGIIVGMPVFFEVGLVLLMPIVVAAARRSGRSPILVAIPLLAGLSIMHGTVPPHPAAMLAAIAYHADLGMTILFGLVVGVPAGIVAGPVLGWFITRQWLRRAPVVGPSAASAAEAALVAGALEGSENVPPPAGAVRAAIAILLPIALIFLGSWADAISAPGSALNRALHFAGSPDVALLIAVLIALVTLGPRVQTDRHHGPELLRKLTTESFGPVANAIVILSAAGGLSGVLARVGRGERHGESRHGCAHASAGAGLAAGRGGTRIDGFGDRGHGGDVGRTRAPGRKHRHPPRTAGHGYRMRLADAVACERLRLLAGAIAVQPFAEANTVDLVGGRDGALCRWFVCDSSSLRLHAVVSVVSCQFTVLSVQESSGARN